MPTIVAVPSDSCSRSHLASLSRDQYLGGLRLLGGAEGELLLRLGCGRRDVNANRFQTRLSSLRSRVIHADVSLE